MALLWEEVSLHLKECCYFKNGAPLSFLPLCVNFFLEDLLQSRVLHVLGLVKWCQVKKSWPNALKMYCRPGATMLVDCVSICVNPW